MMPIRVLLPGGVLLSALMLLGGCAGVVNRASQRLADSLTAGVLDQDDVELARDGIP